MKANRWLAAAVVILLIGFVAESVYLFKVKNERISEKGPSYGSLSTQVLARNNTPPTRSSYAGQWSDPFFGSNAQTWDPFEEMDQIQNMMNRMFRDSFNRGPRAGGFARQSMSYEPDLDVQETADAYLIRLDLPGVEKDKINVKILNNVLVISGERKSEKEETAQNGGFYRMESSFGSFMRSFPLPADADSNAMTAESKNGVLDIRLPKIKNSAQAAKSIQVQ